MSHSVRYDGIMDTRCTYCGEALDGDLICPDCLKEISGADDEFENVYGNVFEEVLS